MDNFDEKYNLKLVAGRDFDIKENHWLPAKLGVEFFVFGRVMYCSKRIIKLPDHEFLHVAQFAKYGTSHVILHYVYHLFKNIMRSGNFSEAFAEIPFEVEARRYDNIKRAENNN